MSEQTVDLHIRAPESLAKELKAKAEANMRSLTSEIVIRLKASVKK